ncbi:hypothetical protein C8J57DRAFT_1732812 [Mycena rebaudengoi]|nr:hypothetical protein C8J57DRAFT_1732812 [Mycena rebaudengoi]
MQRQNNTNPDIVGLSVGYLSGTLVRAVITLLPPESISTFFTLLALLAEATSDPVYLQAATNSANFIRNHMVDSAFLIQDGLSLRQNDLCLPATGFQTYNSGLAIQGFAVLASLKELDGDTQQFLTNITRRRAAILKSDWHGNNGILTSSEDLVSGFLAAYLRNVTSPELHQGLQTLLTVQFNALVDLATAPNTNFYSGQWRGPPDASFDAKKQVAALSPLLSGILITAEPATTSQSSSSGPSSSPTNNPSPPPGLVSSSSKTSVVGPVVGSVVGGIAVLVGAAVWALRRRRRQADTAAHSMRTPFPYTTAHDPVSAVTPWVASSLYNAPASPSSPPPHFSKFPEPLKGRAATIPGSDGRLYTTNGPPGVLPGVSGAQSHGQMAQVDRANNYPESEWGESLVSTPPRYSNA